ncbi:Zinc finger BED domain-containing protein 6 [Eumeta japonica]|uniref:Zinc finger BED domain-containing protein 6 n=1 Tax=Eumeta variegata TaxID=151549 RepID=A0A4C1TXE9_EUMVA|nr:Zinc finger BED domain-containing protein 6 [Eumeta japonica]
MFFNDLRIKKKLFVNKEPDSFQNLFRPVGKPFSFCFGSRHRLGIPRIGSSHLTGRDPRVGATKVRKIKRGPKLKVVQVRKRVNKRARLTIPRKEYYSRNDLVEEQILTNSILQNPKSEAITKSLVKMIAVDMLPLSFVEGPGLLQFLHTVCPDYTVPSRTVIRDRLQGLYDAVRNKLLLTLNKFPHVAITTDGWSSRSNCSFVTITVHGVDEQWNLCSFTLDTLEMLENHTATNTYNYLVKALNNWNLYEKVIAVVHDNARYIVAAIRDNWKSDDDIEMSVRCSCHSLQCSVETALKNVI